LPDKKAKGETVEVYVEIEEPVHHLGNSNFSGNMNSQFATQTASSIYSTKSVD
jgi:hypothetical protein